MLGSLVLSAWHLRLVPAHLLSLILWDSAATEYPLAQQGQGGSLPRPGALPFNACVRTKLPVLLDTIERCFPKSCHQRQCHGWWLVAVGSTMPACPLDSTRPHVAMCNPCLAQGKVCYLGLLCLVIVTADHSPGMVAPRRPPGSCPSLVWNHSQEGGALGTRSLTDRDPPRAEWPPGPMGDPRSVLKGKEHVHARSAFG